MGFKVVFTEPAIADLENLVVPLARDNPSAASNFGYELIETTQKLEVYPFIGRVVLEFKIDNIREVIHRPYRIVYRVHEARELIEVLRVWHGARGIPRL
jgi:plasmid stabilization system protein ParE